MLNKVNLDAKLKKSDLKKLLDEKLGYELGKAQRAARDAGMPVIMVFEGWRHSRRSEIVGKMMQFMDARGFHVEAAAFLYFVLETPSASGSYYGLPSRLVLSEKRYRS